MSDAELRITINLPELDNPEEDAAFKKHAPAMASVIVAAVHEYVKKYTAEQIPSALSVGAACYIASHLIGMSFPDKRRAQVADGLKACLIINDSNPQGLANSPQHTKH